MSKFVYIESKEVHLGFNVTLNDAKKLLADPKLKDRHPRILKRFPELNTTSKDLCKVYLHSSKESMYDKGVNLGLKGDALNKFMYACYEVELTLDIDRTNGEYNIVAVNGLPVNSK